MRRHQRPADASAVLVEVEQISKRRAAAGVHQRSTAAPVDIATTVHNMCWA
jgi:hypothetical protein